MFLRILGFFHLVRGPCGRNFIFKHVLKHKEYRVRDSFNPAPQGALIITHLLIENYVFDDKAVLEMDRTPVPS